MSISKKSSSSSSDKLRYGRGASGGVMDDVVVGFGVSIIGECLWGGISFLENCICVQRVTALFVCRKRRHRKMIFFKKSKMRSPLLIAWTVETLRVLV